MTAQYVQPGLFYERYEVCVAFAWAMVLVPSLALITWMLLSDRREKRKRAERRLRGERVAEPTFLHGPMEVGELSPGTVLTLHVGALIVVHLFLHWISTWMTERFSKLDPALASNLTLQSLVTLVRQVFHVGGNLIMWLVILNMVRTVLWEETREAYRAYKKSCEERRKNPPPPMRSFRLYRPSAERPEASK
jgi:hypothetical protein